MYNPVLVKRRHLTNGLTPGNMSGKALTRLTVS
jgi:hypothetical protein